MTAAMREAVVSVLYKGRDKPRELLKSYRPISITPSEYRIMTAAIQLALRGVVCAVIGETQMGYLNDDRYAHDNTLLLAEMARLLDAGDGSGGVAVQIDNSAAFDRVRWDFMHDMLEIFGLPDAFRQLMKTLYHDLHFSVRVDGMPGASNDITNGVRQGCGASPL
eukprot:1755587-Prymnesium_polylepis.1